MHINCHLKSPIAGLWSRVDFVIDCLNSDCPYSCDRSIQSDDLTLVVSQIIVSVLPTVSIQRCKYENKTDATVIKSQNTDLQQLTIEFATNRHDE